MAPKAKFTRQELEALIAEGMDIHEIASVLGVTKNHIYNRCYKFKLQLPNVHHKDRMITKGELEQLVKSGKTTGEIVKYFNCDRTLVSKMCRHYQLPLPKRGHADVRKYTYNEHFFSTIDSEEKAYVLGFIVADGCVISMKTINRLDIKVRLKDIGLMEKFCEVMACNFKPLKDALDAEVRLSGKLLVEDLAKYGVVPRKTFIVPFAKNVPEPYIMPYIRGVFDGDGSVAKRYRYATLTTGSDNFVRGFSQWYEHKYGFKPHVYRKAGSNAVAFVFTRKDKAFMDDMYAESKIHLDRKRDRYLKLWPFSQVKK